ncbi:type VI secretion system protein TssA [Acerihabitans sp. TG2]|uniref:type VI secretion system protein TssA n=1 Tax=Acerihabitans sp. TG2 TaxID=3096008 RepID=UPI002B23C2C1|nr:type VI secretion system protein TssA [Acerihabitans sp. TG2]MEA9393106.1 type VI secretion system protein TssA [Acerihabitans sp. TG2]
MATLQSLLCACREPPAVVQQQAQQQLILWENWLKPISPVAPTGEDPGYDDDFQCMREQVNKLSGADTDLVSQLAEKLLTTTTKDIRVATYYIWARLQRDGEAGLADGLELLAGLLQYFGDKLHPQRNRSRKAALEWLAGQRVLDSLSLYPEVTENDLARIAGALFLIEQTAERLQADIRPDLGGLYHALAIRLEKSGGADALVPQNISTDARQPVVSSGVSPALTAITSGRELLDQVRALAKYLRDQPDGWLAGHHLMKSLRHDTLHQLPPLAGDGRTRIEPPKPDQRALLKRLYLQQSWLELLEQADGLFSRGACHLWLDLQWYIHQALTRMGGHYAAWANIIAQDVKGLLLRLPGLEVLAFNDGTPFADEVTRQWLHQLAMDNPVGWQDDTRPTAGTAGDDAILQLEPEALQLADSDGPEAALSWLQQRPDITTCRNRWLIRLLMARVAEQYGRNDMALHLLGELAATAVSLTLTHWEPELLFEVNARCLKLLRVKGGRSETDRARLQPEMERLLAGLIAIDPARAMVLCG